MSTCVITGASAGIGRALAYTYAEQGYSLSLVARSMDKLLELQKDIQEKYKVAVKIYPADITKNTIELCEKIARENEDIGIVINNAGMGAAGEFLSHTIDQENAVISLNIQALTDITWFFGCWMRERKKGTIVEISSVGSMMPGPYIASYYASKAYVSSLSLSLSYELRKDGVFVCLMNLPRVDTSFDQNAGRTKKLKKGADAQKIARIIYKRAEKKKRISNIGFSTKFTNFILRITPKSLSLRIMGKALS